MIFKINVFFSPINSDQVTLRVVKTAPKTRPQRAWLNLHPEA